jgi:glyoxylase-like metal-dependent hydrolase (beta-lactamase superfamily II)
MKAFEIIKYIFIVGGPEITDSRDGCVYLMNLGDLVLIDSGAGWSVDKILYNIGQLGFDCGKLTTIFLTHCHIDHTGGAPVLKNRFGSKIYIHKLDAPPLERGDSGLTAASWYQTLFPPTPVDVKFSSPQEILEIGDQEIVCLHTPGHNAGSVSISR